MKHFYIFILVLPISLFAQCPPTGGLFTSQAQIDALAIDYPDCTEVGAFVISGDDISDLSGLYQINSCTSFSINNNLILENTIGLNPNIVIRYVEGTGTSFSIQNNAALLSVDGLDNLDNQSGFESDFRIKDNPMLLSVEGVPNSFNALDIFEIENNDSLISLIGLENVDGAGLVTRIIDNDALVDLNGLGAFWGEWVIISDNDSLESLDGSQFGSFDDYLVIENNQSLTDISAIYAGSYLDDSLTIRNNPNLSMCSTENVCFYIQDMGMEGLWFSGVFENNAPGCNSNSEVEYACGINSNDDCGYPGSSEYLENQILLGETITANNEYATTSSYVPNCNDVENRKDVWFAFDSGENTSIDIFLDSGFYCQLWEGYCNYGLSQVVNGCGSEGVFDVVVTPNTAYLIQVWNDDTTDDRGGSSWFDLTVQDGTLSTTESVFQEFRIFPNPTNGLLKLESNLLMDSVKIYNVLGQNVMHLTSNIETVDLSHLKNGMYFVQVEIEGKTSTYKVLKA